MAFLVPARFCGPPSSGNGGWVSGHVGRLVATAPDQPAVTVRLRTPPPLDREMEGWDHAISSDPAVLRAVVEDGRTIHEALGSTRRMLSEAEIVKRRQFRRSLVTRAALPAGHVLTEADLDAKRPGTGIGPDELGYVVGRELAADLAEDQVLRWEHLR